MLVRTLLFLLSVTFAEPVWAEPWDTGTSQNLLLKKKLDGSWYVVSRSNFATRDGTLFFLAYADGNLGYRLGKAWSLELGYRHFWLKLSSGWRGESRPLTNLGWRAELAGWQVSNRHRLEYRLLEADSHIRYRNESRLTAPWAILGWPAKLFVEEEVFYAFTDQGVNLNWVTAGLKASSGGLMGKLGYRWQAQKMRGVWRNRHVLVTGFGVFF